MELDKNVRVSIEGDYKDLRKLHEVIGEILVNTGHEITCDNRAIGNNRVVTFFVNIEKE